MVEQFDRKAFGVLQMRQIGNVADLARGLNRDALLHELPMREINVRNRERNLPIEILR